MNNFPLPAGYKNIYSVIASLVLILPFFLSCASNASSAEEYYEIGMAYFEMGKYEEAERWLNRAKSADKTMTASEYNLGRIAFAAGRFRDAAVHFENILAWDSDNVMALKGAAYSRIKNGEPEKAKLHYSRVLLLIPESADDGYNYALVLYAMEDFSGCEDTLLRYEHSLETDNDALLLLARAQAKSGKPEAADSYAKWFANSKETNSAINHEYGIVLEKLSFYARALEQFRNGLDAVSSDVFFPGRKDFHFAIGRVLLTADPENKDAINELTAAVDAGFKDIAALEELTGSGINTAERESIERLIEKIKEAQSVSEK